VMFCPHCGQQQVSEHLRYCSRCGFPMEGVAQLLGNGGMLPLVPAGGDKQMSPRKRGVKHGALLLLGGVVAVPALGVLYSFTQGPSILDILVPLAAIICFIGGPMRMLYAALFEEGGTPWPKPAPAIMQAQPVMPPPSATPPLGWRSTSELGQPASVTENTTRLLDEQRDPRNQSAE
jgi:hypothetical protein